MWLKIFTLFGSILATSTALGKKTQSQFGDSKCHYHFLVALTGFSIILTSARLCFVTKHTFTVQIACTMYLRAQARAPL
jgi:hypothetical protein